MYQSDKISHLERLVHFFLLKSQRGGIVMIPPLWATERRDYRNPDPVKLFFSSPEQGVQLSLRAAFSAASMTW